MWSNLLIPHRDDEETLERNFSRNSIIHGVSTTVASDGKCVKVDTLSEILLALVEEEFVDDDIESSRSKLDVVCGPLNEDVEQTIDATGK